MMNRVQRKGNEYRSVTSWAGTSLIGTLAPDMRLSNNAVYLGITIAHRIVGRSANNY